MGTVRTTMNVDESTSTLVRAAQSGATWAHEKLVQRFDKLVWATVRSFRLRDADAHDAVQNTWLRMFEHIDAVREPDRLAGWLATTARRECIKIIKAAGREVAGLEQHGYDRPDSEPTPDRLAVDRELSRLLWEYVGELPCRGRAMVTTLTGHDAPSYAEFARAVGIPLGSVGPTRIRYLRKLRRRLEESGLGAHCWS
jgi:RNA polymerase sigma factor (sigma-70 family)